MLTQYLYIARLPVTNGIISWEKVLRLIVVMLTNGKHGSAGPPTFLVTVFPVRVIQKLFCFNYAIHSVLLYFCNIMTAK